MFLFWTNSKLWKKYPSTDCEDNAKEQDPGYNAALEDLKKSKEAKDGSFSSKLKYWQTSNKAKMSAETEKHNVGILLTLLFKPTKIYLTNFNFKPI